MRFGLVHMNIRTKQKYSRPSAYAFKDIVCSNGIPDHLFGLQRIPEYLSGV
jgi:beta-glucosidase/6-phospho-beta-glucosidase/beta-galactosidase